MKWNQPCIGLAMLLCTFTSLEARTVQWGLPSEAVLFQSDGITPIDTTFTFLLGSFATNFNPIEASYETWADNWYTFDRGFLDPTALSFQNETYLLEDGLSDSVYADDYDFRSQQLYMWVFNSNAFDPSQPTTRESGLFTGATWQLPAEGAPCCGDASLPLKFFVSSMTAAVTGSFIPDFTIDPDELVIGELGSATLPSQLFDLQTHSITVIPEPSLSILGVISVVGFSIRRRR
jgi:hypothetical protein